jgi:hypothetical protein
MRAASTVAFLIVLLAGGMPAMFFYGAAKAEARHAGDYQAGLHDGAAWQTDMATSFNNTQAAILQHDGLAGYCVAMKGAGK